MSILNSCPIQLIVSNLKCYLKIVLKRKETILFMAIILPIIWGIIVFLYKYFIRKKCLKFCERVRDDLDNQDSVLASVLIDRKILKRMYPKVKIKYIDLCLEKMRKEGDIFTDQFGQDRYKRKI
jgi:hypothetical protein